MPRFALLEQPVLEHAEWHRLLEVNPAGSVPVVKDRETGEWFTDSAKFVDYLEDKQPAPALGKTPDVPEIGSQVFPKFVAAIKAAPEDKSVLQPVEEVRWLLQRRVLWRKS